MRFFSICISLSAISIGGMRFSSAAEVSERTQSSVEVRPRDEGSDVTIRNKTYQVVRVSFGSLRRLLLLRQEVYTVSNTDYEGYRKSEVLLDVSDIGGPARKSLFSIRERGSSAQLEDFNTLFVVDEWGCCGSGNTHAVYSLLSGKRLFFTGGEAKASLLYLTRPDHHAGVVGLHVSGSARDADIYGKRPDSQWKTLLRVSYSDYYEVQDSIVIAVGEEIAPWGPTARWSAQPGVSLDGLHYLVPEAAATKPVVIEIAVSPGKVVKLPLIEGKFDESGGLAPGGIKLMRVPPR